MYNMPTCYVTGGKHETTRGNNNQISEN